MAKNNSQDLKSKKIVFHWQFPETLRKKSKKQYLIGGFVVLALFIWAIWDKNFLFAFFLILLIFTFILELRRKPLMVDFYIFEDGVGFSKKFYPWEDIKNFRIVYEPPKIKRLYLDFKGAFNPNTSVPLENENPVEIRRFLKKYIPEDLDRPYETLIDKINRYLGL